MFASTCPILADSCLIGMQVLIQIRSMRLSFHRPKHLSSRLGSDVAVKQIQSLDPRLTSIKPSGKSEHACRQQVPNSPHPTRDRGRLATLSIHYFSRISVMDEMFLSAFLSTGSNYAAATSIPQIAWITEMEASLHVPDASFSFGDISIAPNNAAIAPTQVGTRMDSSLGAALGPPQVQVQNTPAHAMTMHSEPASVSSCNIVSDIPCNRPLDGTLQSIRQHLSLHGHKHQGRDMVQCPWAGCSDKLRWMNIPRHIRSIHLGVRMVCPTCERSFTRPLGLAKHVASNKCSVVTDIDELNTQGISDCMLK
ncbi:hypothetical protein OG21DRAFT_1061468 [Imleria badia]|nr:hypothetical protein OG21DRAFT_1061468 [Imleria badia]